MLFQLFGTNQEEMLEHLEQGDVADTVQVFFEQSNVVSITWNKCSTHVIS